jgi:hypothetical protein
LKKIRDEAIDSDWERVGGLGGIGKGRESDEEQVWGRWGLMFEQLRFSSSSMSVHSRFLSHSALIYVIGIRYCSAGCLDFCVEIEYTSGETIHPARERKRRGGN